MLPNVLVYIGFVFRTAWGHSASLARNTIFYSVVIIGAAAFLVPILGMTIDTAGLLSLLSNPKFGFGLFGAIVLSRLLCAPYWIWKDDQKTIASLREGHNAKGQRRNRNIAKLHEFYGGVGSIIERPLPRNIPENDFDRYANEGDMWVINCANWVGENIGNPARQRFLQTGRSHEQVIGAVNEEHSNVILNLTMYRANLLALIENYDAWDAKE